MCSVLIAALTNPPNSKDTIGLETKKSLESTEGQTNKTGVIPHAKTGEENLCGITVNHNRLRILPAI
jgi:hypothetical protein